MNFILLHIFCCFLMTGVIWVIQWVHYPSFYFIKSEDSHSFHFFHQLRITWIVAPLMLIELLTSYSLIYLQNHWIYFYVPNGLLFIIWISTLLISAPIHKKLTHSHSKKLILLLVKTNWIRTISWSVRSIIFIYLLFQRTSI